MRVDVTGARVYVDITPRIPLQIWGSDLYYNRGKCLYYNSYNFLMILLKISSVVFLNNIKNISILATVRSVNEQEQGVV